MTSIGPQGKKVQVKATPDLPPPVPATEHVTVRQARDRAQYVRQQKGHSFILEWLVFGIFTAFIRPIYLSVSPNHYFHL